MTKLEEEIRQAMIDGQWGVGAPEAVILDLEAIAAAEVAKKYIEKAYDDAYRKAFFMQPIDEDTDVRPHGDRNQWLKENGITE